MINPRELRVDNLVYLIDERDGSRLLRNINVYNLRDAQFFEPVPLIEESLLSLGFTKSSNHFAISNKEGDKEFRIFTIYKDKVILETLNYVRRNSEYNEEQIWLPLPSCIHRLQNQWYFLTGEELQITKEYEEEIISL